jgi:quinol monooxygenase YgiN
MRWGVVIITMEAQAPEHERETLIRSFEYAMKQRPNALLESYLTQDSIDQTLWRVVSVWESEAALEAYAASSNVIPSAYAFHVLGIAPVASLSRVVAANVLQASRP